MGAQTHILTLVADGKAQLLVGNRNTAALGLAGQQLDLDDLGRAQGGGDELGNILTPADDIDLLAVQLLHDLLHADAAGTDAGADGIDIGVLAPDGQLGAGTGLAGDGLDLNGAVIDLGNLQLKHTLDKAGMGAADGDAGAAVRCQNIHDIDLHGLTLGEGLAGDLLIAGQHGGAALAQIQHNVAALGVDGDNRGGDQLMCAGLHLAALQVALTLAQTLTDDMLCRLGGNAAKLLGLEGGDHALADLVALADLLGILQTDLRVGVLDLLHDVAQQACAEGAYLGVNVNDNIVILDLIVLLDGDDDGCLDLVDQVVLGQAALLFQCGKSLKKFVVRSSHVSGFLPIIFQVHTIQYYSCLPLRGCARRRVSERNRRRRLLARRLKVARSAG